MFAIRYTLNSFAATTAAAMLLLLTTAPAASADDGSPVSISVTSNDGWVEAIGRAAGHEIWRKRLIRQGDRGISLVQGAETSFVSVGSRVFRIDNNSGYFREVGQQRVRHEPTGPAPQPILAPPPAEPYPGTPPLPPPAAEPVIPAPAPQLGGISESECREIQHCQVLMERVRQATDRVLLAVAELNSVNRYGELYRGEREAAVAALGAARARLMIIRMHAIQQLTSMYDQPGSYTPRQQQAIDEQEKVVVELNLKLNQALEQFADLHANAAPQDKLVHSLDDVKRLREQVDKANEKLERLRSPAAATQPEA